MQDNAKTTGNITSKRHERMWYGSGKNSFNFGADPDNLRSKMGCFSTFSRISQIDEKRSGIFRVLLFTSVQYCADQNSKSRIMNLNVVS